MFLDGDMECAPEFVFRDCPAQLGDLQGLGDGIEAALTELHAPA